MEVFPGEYESNLNTGHFKATLGLKSELNCSPREIHPGLPLGSSQ
nr:RS ORF2 (bp 588-293) first start codon is located at base 427.; putative [Mus musculus domesticus]